MRKLLVFPILLTAIFADFGVSAATVRGGRSVASTLGATEESAADKDKNTEDSQKTGSVGVGENNVAARAANRNRVKQTNTTTTQNATGARVATRTSARSTVPKANTATQTTAPAKPTTSNVVARSGVKQKAVNMGTKVSAAQENTIMSQECQDAFYGCMDSFCMMENTSGGRCRCDNRGAELDEVLDKLLQSDERSKYLAQEGVERIQRGETVDEIYSMAEEIEKKVSAEQSDIEQDLLQDGTKRKNRTKTLDLSVFNSNSMFDTDDMLDFDGGTFDSGIAEKKGDALRNEAFKMCSSKMPQQCREHMNMLQGVYAGRIRSDCISYENYLKQQKMNSETLLQTAKKAMRDAAATAYEEANKYDLGQCTIRFRQCMIGEDVCGDGFQNCVVNKGLISQASSKTQKIKTGTTFIEVDATTYDSLTSKKPMCEHVLKQCVKAADKVWGEFLKSVAPELKAAEYAMEDNQRRNCAKNVISCIKEVAADNGLKEGTDAWSVFTQDEASIRQYCGDPLRQCGAYDPAMEASVFRYVRLSLDAIRADQCTTAIRNCLQDDNHCHKDYSNCVGASLGVMWSMCEDIVTVDCTGKEAALREQYTGVVAGIENMPDRQVLMAYVGQVAQGLILSINNELTAHCQQAIEKAIIGAGCSSTSCDGSFTIADQYIDKLFEYKICKDKCGGTCYDDVSVVTADNATDNWMTCIGRYDTGYYRSAGTYTDVPWCAFIESEGRCSCAGGGSPMVVNNAIESLCNSALTKVVEDAEVKKCVYGADMSGFGRSDIKARNTGPVFTNLTENAKQMIVQGINGAVIKAYQTKYQEYLTKSAEDSVKIVELAGTMTDAKLLKICQDFAKARYPASTTGAKYSAVKAFIDPATHECRISMRAQFCATYNDTGTACTEWGKETYQTVDMSDKKIE